MICYYQDECWRIKSLPVRRSLMGMLKDSDPKFKIEIVNTSNPRRVKLVSLGDVILDGE